jgi:hypothetical protein
MSYRRLPGGKLDIRDVTVNVTHLRQNAISRGRSGIAISVLIFLITVSSIVAYGARCTATVLDRFSDSVHPLIQMLLALSMLVMVLGPFVLIGLVAAKANARAGRSPEEPNADPRDEVTEGPAARTWHRTSGRPA